MKILNCEKYDDQINFTKSSIKNKLFEITKEFKEFNYQHNLWIEFTKNVKVFLKQNIH